MTAAERGRSSNHRRATIRAAWFVLKVWAAIAALLVGGEALWALTPAWVPLGLIVVCVFGCSVLIAMEP